MGAITKEQAIALAGARLRLQKPKDYKALSQPGTYDPTQEMGFLDKFNAGMGKAFYDIGQGAAQMVGMGESGEELGNRRELDAPLMKTGAGVAGNVAGNIAAFAPVAAIPGANTVAGAGALGSTIAALQPAETAGERLTNQAVGGLLGSGTQALAGPVAQRLGERAGARMNDLQAQQSRNTVRDETIRMGQQAGYVVPPSAVNQPSFIGGRLESLGGKAALGQEAAIRNQPVTDRLAREAASLKPDQPLNISSLRQARFDLAAPHREISSLSPQAADDLAALQQAKFDSKMAWKEFNRQGNRQAFNDATKAGAEVKRLERALETHATQAGRTDLVAALKTARTKIAQNRTVQNALNRGTGSVDASVIGRELDSGAPLTGPLETIGRYQQAFPHFMREGSKVQAPGVGKTELLASALLGGGGIAASGPVGAVAALAPFASHPTRSMLLSQPVQRHLAQPNYSAGAFTRGASALGNEETRRRLAQALRASVLPSIPLATQ